LIWLLALHAVVGAAIVAGGRRIGRRGALLGAVPPLVTLGWLALEWSDVMAGTPVVEHTGWVPDLGIAIDLRLDAFAALMVLLVAGIGVVVMLYSSAYFASGGHDVGRLAGVLTLFAGAMLGVVLADDLLVLYTCWELTSVTSYLLIGHDHTEAKARAAALHALLVTVTGGLAMLGGFVLLGQAAGTFRLSEILEHPPSGGAVNAALALVLLGAFTKSAQYPFHGWLPGAMAAPTPVSAYLHSATMVKAGIYVLARFTPAFAVTGFWRPAVIGIGLLSMIGGGLRALRQNDLKLLLAFGTVSQLGFLAVLFGLGSQAAVEAGCVLLLAHGAFKAALFMVAGILDRQTGTRDLRELPPLGPGWWPLVAVAAVSAASMAGLPLLLGFVAKEAAYAAALESGFAWSGWVAGGLVAGSILTVAYSARIVWGAFVLPVRRRPAGPGQGREAVPSPPPAAFLGPVAVLGVASVLLGLLPGRLDDLVGAATGALDESAPDAHLALWHGLGAPLALSAVTVALGALAFAARAPLARALSVGDRLPSGADVYLALLRGLHRTATRVTAVVQNGSLPIYAGVILLTAAVLPAVTLHMGASWPGWPEAVDTPAHLPVAALIIGSALAAATNRRRISAVLFLGLTGYAMAALYVVQGAPDLALTTVAIETLSTVLFVLVLRHLPVRFERKASRQRGVVRLVVAGTVGLSVFAFALLAGGSRTAEPVSSEMVQRSLPDGHGRNVVNVILVDFRGLDTMGEITVLAAAAIGAVALARAGRRPRRVEAAEAAEAGRAS
jgi:multicomponent Na+:H+ antiporter subunit A